jgi:hypothetical protein
VLRKLTLVLGLTALLDFLIITSHTTAFS